MKRFTVIVILLIVGFLLLSIGTYSQAVVKWQQGAKNSEVSLVDGVETKTIKVDGIRVSASLFDRKGGVLHAFISVENRGHNYLGLDRSDSFLVLKGSSDLILRSKDPDALASSLDGRGINTLTQSSRDTKIAAQNGPPGIRQPDGTMVPVPGAATAKVEAQATLMMASSERMARASRAAAASYIRANSIRTEKVLPGPVVEGNIWFDNKHYKEAVLSLKIGDTTFEFPFVGNKK